MELLKSFSSLDLSDLDFSELEDATISLTRNFVQNLTNLKNGEINIEKFNENSLACIKHLKIVCSKGSAFQNLVCNTNGLLTSLKEIIENKEMFTDDVRLKCFQLLANMCVQNEKCQNKIWREMNEMIMKIFQSADAQQTNVAAMIIYNLILAKNIITEHSEAIFHIALDHYGHFVGDKNSSTALSDFSQILLGYFVCQYANTMEIYENMESEKKRLLLYYIHDHVENETNEIIRVELLSHLILEFKRNSDCVLKTVTTYVEKIDPQNLVALLDIISTASAQDKYKDIWRNDPSLFLNIGCLLNAIHKLGKETQNSFSAIQNLEAIVSDRHSEIEREISYEFKTKLVKTLANLSHRNKKNQELAREMEIMSSIFECTNADARNPLIKEWSILAIRNLCEQNLENQDIVRNLTRVGDASNPVLSEFGLEDGVFRISK